MAKAKCNGKYVDPTVIASTPFGRENAKSALDIFKDAKCWAPNTVRQRLSALSKVGRVQCADDPRVKGMKRYVYWREPEFGDETATS